MDDTLFPRNRVGKARAKLPEEYQLAQFLRDTQNKHPSWNTDTPACEWHCVDCIEKAEIYRIRFSDSSLIGTLYWAHLSSIKCSHLFLDHNELMGEVELQFLPFNIQSFNGRNNEFDGTLNLEDMPPSLHTLDLSYCKMHGSISLGLLSPQVRGIYLGRNMFSGSLYLWTIPSRMTSLWLSHNNFSGPVDLRHLPYRIWLGLDHNQNLSGEYDPIWFSRTIYVGGTQIKILPKRGSYRCLLPLRYVIDSDVWQF